METICPLCKCRISEMSLATGRAIIVKFEDNRVPPQVAHKDCLVDYKLCNGKEYGE